MIVLADTNILLDVLQDRQPFSDPAARVWELVEKKELVGYVSAISFNNVFYVERKNVGFEKALNEIKAIRSVFRTVPLDDAVIDRALALPGSDFEDGIQAAAVTCIAADYLVTRDERDFDSMGVRSVTAVELLALLLP